jgi:hypothetical protein
MPYELSFTKRVPIVNRDEYINECCVGGDVISARLQPVVRERYRDVQAEQEDWGWFIWFRRGPVSLAIDIFTDDPETGEFRIHLTSRTKKFGLFSSVQDLPELEEVRELVLHELDGWTETPCRIERIDRDRLGSEPPGC